MLLAHFQLGTNSHLQVLFSKAKMSIKIVASLAKAGEMQSLKIAITAPCSLLSKKKTNPTDTSW